MAVLDVRPPPSSPAPERRPSRALLVLAGLSAAALLATAIGLAVDDRVITGAPAWLKPAKFAISIVIYSATLAWLLRWVPGHRRAVQVIAWVTALALAAELVLIAVQVVRGTTSHFNDGSAFDAAVFTAMGGLISAVFLAAAAAALLLFRGSALPAPMTAAVRGGLLVSLLGMAQAGFMLANTSGGGSGGHTVGAPDGGPGLPLTGWSTEYGDLRIGHFVGLHALQLLPLAVWLIRRTWPQLADRVVTRLVVVLTVGMAGLVLGLTWQALREQPLLAPDALTLGAGLGWLLLVGGAAALVLRPERVPA